MHLAQRLPSDCPSDDVLLREVIDGLGRPQKSLPSKLLYDEYGSQLFDRICELEEYYPTRTETQILKDNLPEIVCRFGPDCLLVEFGSGSSTKTRLLLDRAADLYGYVPVDISGDHLAATAAELAAAYPHLRVFPVCADYTQDVSIPRLSPPPVRTVVFFPGSTIGNFTPEEAAQFLRRIRRLCGPEGGLLIGVDLQKDVAVLEQAYNDAQGVTAAFNLNILRHVNREFEGTFDLSRFQHRAFYNGAKGRIEMHLVSIEDQAVRVSDAVFTIRRGETIRTEYSYKYTLEGFAALAGEAGFETCRVWTDVRDYFSLQYLLPATV
ncbi:MAG TPA: L-histidine N(alpha)-methyltransferase [Rhodothermales bacterium]|nr:L-histidine N(alpha)-methyltransferase [Rhodothermales bacterium]